MNKILNINLGGYALTIDDDAYEYLQAYLESIRRRFSESEGRDEIVADIEARLGEILTEALGSRTIVMLPDVEAAVTVMGKPEDFGGETVETKQQQTRTGSKQPGVKTGKRLFRDEEDAVVAGVCSGLSAYFGITDPVWMRLFFVVLTFVSFGFWVPAYVLLWILVPPAKSAADRLAMRGQPVNVDNIAREIEDTFERLGSRMNDLGNDNKFKGSSPGATAMNKGVNAIGSIFGFLVRFIAKFGVLLFMLVGFALFIALAVSWVAGIWSLMAAAPYFDYFSPYSNAGTWLGFTNIFFLLGIPIVALCLVFTRVLFKVRTPVWLRSGLAVFWAVNLVSAIILIGSGVRQYRHSGTVSSNVDLSGISSDTLRVEGFKGINSPDDYEDFWFNHDNEGVRIGANSLEVSGPIEVRVRKSESNQFRCTQVVKAQGITSLDAQENATQVQYMVNVSDNTIRVPTSYSISKGRKWRVQRIRLNIEVPEGKSVIFDDKIYRYSGADLDDYTEENDENYISHEPNRVYRMTNEGLICTNCPQFGDRNYRSDRSYEKFIFEGNIQAEIRQGNDFRVEIEGSDADKSKIQRIQAGDKITFTTNGKKLDGPVHVLVEAHTFTSLHADNSGEIVIRGFEEGQASITAKGSSAIKAYIDSRSLNVALSGNATLDLTGRGDNLEVNLTDNSSLESTNWRAESGEIYTSESARARVFIKQNALVVSTGSSSVRVDGGAEVRNNR